MDGILALVLLGAAFISGWSQVGIFVCAVLAIFSAALYIYMSMSTGRIGSDLSIHKSIGKLFVTNYFIHLLAMAVIYGIGFLVGSIF